MKVKAIGSATDHDPIRPNLPEGTQFQSCHLNPDGETYTVTGLRTWGRAPFEISQLQGKLQLSALGLFDTVEDIVGQAGQPTKIYWQTAATWQRTSPIIAGLAGHLGMGEQELDEFFTQAAKIK